MTNDYYIRIKVDGEVIEHVKTPILFGEEQIYKWAKRNGVCYSGVTATPICFLCGVPMDAHDLRYKRDKSECESCAKERLR